jgi:hypothetical protein
MGAARVKHSATDLRAFWDGGVGGETAPSLRRVHSCGEFPAYCAPGGLPASFSVATTRLRGLELFMPRVPRKSTYVFRVP